MEGKRGNQSQTSTLSGMLRSRFFRGFLAFTILGIFYLSLFVSHQHVNVFSIVGGVAGVVSTVIVVATYSRSSKAYSTLFWRAMCDLGVALRFVLVPAFNYYTCNNTVCSFSDTNEDLCQLPSAILQFFLVASEMWFFCHGLDLYFTVNNPFSSYESRVWKYHLFTWGMALFITIFPYMSQTVSTVYGFWYISNSATDGSGYPVCWFKIQAATYLGWPIFVLFFMPLAIVYLFCLMTVVLAYVRLRKGLTQSFLPRVKLLVTSISNIVVLMLFWGTAMIIYGMTYQLRDNKVASDRTFNILMFMIASKAFSSLVVAINQVDYQKSDVAIGNDDANTALREEVLSFATAGIKNTAMTDAFKGTTAFTRRPRINSYRKTNTLVTPWFFFRLLFDHDGEGLRAVKDMLEKNKRTMHTGDGMAPTQEETRSLLSSDSTRMSQRSTLTTNPSTTMSPFAHHVATTTGNQNNTNTSARRSLDDDHGQDEEAAGVGSFAIHHASGKSLPPDASAGDASDNIDGSAGVTREHGPSEIRMGSEGTSFVLRHSDMVDVDAINNSSIYVQQPWSSRIVSTCQYFVNAFENDKVEFKELQPYYFQQIRKAYGVSKELYADEFSKSIKQRMTEGGASGAFFFFSKSDKFVGKSCTEEEMDVLVQNAQVYSEYMTKNINTFICKIYGVYELRIYNEVLYFFVMNNLFLNDDGLTMNEKYDLKGSWVARNSAPPRDGQTFSCTYCERKFVYRKKRRNNNKRAQVSQASYARTQSMTSEDDVSAPTGVEVGKSQRSGNLLASLFAGLFGGSDGSGSGSGGRSGRSNTIGAANGPQRRTVSDSVELHDLSTDFSAHAQNLANDVDDDRCPFTTGEHFPNVIMKDNDIKHKIRLTEMESYEVQNQLRMDAEFLTSLGIMDYSLLVGVHIAEYEVDQSQMDPHYYDNTCVLSSPKASSSPMASADAANAQEGGEDVSQGSSSPAPMLSMSNKQRSMVRRTGTMAKRNVADVSPGSSNVEKPPSLPHVPSFDLESGTNSVAGVSISSSSSMVPASTQYKLTRKLAVHKIIGPDAYFMGIIDFQQRWNFSKRMERFFKIYFKGADPEGLSAIEPVTYKERFLRKIEDILEQETVVRNIYK